MTIAVIIFEDQSGFVVNVVKGMPVKMFNIMTAQRIEG